MVATSTQDTTKFGNATVTITLPTVAATPVFSPGAGSYSTIQTVTISDATPGSTIYYTTNGSQPTSSSTKYTGPITLSSSETLEAIATAAGYLQSAVATAFYTISNGIVETGQKPVAGARVYVLAASNAGYGQSSSSLLNSAQTGYSDTLGAYVLTDTTGNFLIAGRYTCVPGTQVYLYATGGDAGSGNNQAIGLLAALGNCPASGNFTSAAPSVVVNEVSTIATAFSFAGYATDPSHVSSSGSMLAQIGVKNAFATVANLETLSSGIALVSPPAGNGISPMSMTNSLANILWACASSNGPTSLACSTLFANAKSNGATGITAADTATAALNIAHNPGTNVANLFSLAASAPFQPSLLSQPNDFTLEINYYGGGLSTAYGMAVDANGNIWITSSCCNSTTNLSEFSPTGAPMSGAAGYAPGTLSSPTGLAVDSTGNLWVADTNINGCCLTAVGSLVEFSPAGTLMSTITNGGLAGPLYVAIDGSKNIWTSNMGVCPPCVSQSVNPVYDSNLFSEFNSSGTAISGSSGYAPLKSYFGQANIAFDTTGHLWGTIHAANQSDPLQSQNYLFELDSSGNALLLNPINTPFRGLPSSLAFDGSGNLWGPSGNSLVEFDSSGVEISPLSGYTGGGLNSPFPVAIDGAGNIWVVNGNSSGLLPGSFSEFNSAGIPITGPNGYQQGPSYFGAVAIAIDGSGNVWTASGSRLYELIGAATPVATPIAANLMAPYGAHAVNKP